MKSKPDHRNLSTHDDTDIKNGHIDDIEIVRGPESATLDQDVQIAQDGNGEAALQQEHADRIMRMQAEFENYRKRVARDMASAYERATDDLLLEILPLYDSVLRAVHLHEEPQGKDESAISEGLRQIGKQFSQWLDSKGIQPIAAVGNLFDPQRHEAVLTVESDRPRNEIIEEFELGYFRYDRVLRPSKVSVSRGAKEEESS
ncbi:nucleotide exchange factor GrpE [Candidatus Bipolaricaulota bacterium]|nr:nucleotide exchange factor GrpE [Candidatus Bipolaricaulota bacterium]